MPTKISQLAEYTTITGSAFVPIVDVLESVSSKNKKITVDDLRKLFYVNAAGSSSFTKHTPGFYYFGDNSDGRAFYTGSITTLRSIISGSGKRGFGSTQDGPPVIKNFSSLFVSRSVVLKPTNRCRGLLIFVDGDATISGSISMTARGAKFTGSDASFTVVNPPYLGDYWSSLNFPTSSYLSRVFAVGAAGGAAGTPGSRNGSSGGTGILGRAGGGGGGGTVGASGLGGAGSTGTSFSGGAGGGGGGTNPVSGNATAGSGFGGRGGIGGPSGGAGGAGNPGGPAGSPSTNSGENGTGGLLILIVRGKLKIGPNGSIVSNGSSGGFGGISPQASGGGGSGGGVIYIYYGDTFTNTGTITTNGGSGGSTNSPTVGVGGNGGAGSLTTAKLNTAFPVVN